MHDLFLIIGRTASGKSSIANLVASEMKLSVLKSYTTRPMRPGEEHGSDHIFINEDEFQIYKNSIVAYTEINGYKYFCTKNQLMKADIYVIDPAGVAFFKEHYHGAKKVKVLGIWATEPARKKRMFLRGDPEDAIVKRLENDRTAFSTDICDIVFYNKNLQETREAVAQCISWYLFTKN